MSDETSARAVVFPAIHPHFRLQWEQTQGAYVLLYPEGMVKLNESAGEILSRCDGKTSVDDIITGLEEKYPDATGIREDILDFFVDATDRQWLTDG